MSTGARSTIIISSTITRGRASSTHKTNTKGTECRSDLANFAAIEHSDRGGKRTGGESQPLVEGTEAYELVDFKQPSESELREARRQAKRAEKVRRLDAEDEMKFSHSIQFNAVPDWSSRYIAYSNLKKL